jgi:poly [ADP-ribose] polymerase
MPLAEGSSELEMVRKYTKLTHGPTHNQYSLEVGAVYAVEREGESKRYSDYVQKHSLGNKQLLWHGSRITNWAGILSTGLRIAPPEAPVTGYMFDKGLYFADIVSKAANYCKAPMDGSSGFLALSEVALGEARELTEAHYEAADFAGPKAQKGKAAPWHTKGVGRFQPSEVQHEMLGGDVSVPMGTPAPKQGVTSSLLYNEFVVYDPSQVRMRFLVELKFHPRAF